MIQPWWMIADIGGTNARFWAVSPQTVAPLWQGHYLVGEYPNFSDVLDQVLIDLKVDQALSHWPERACFAVACPTDLDRMVFTNSHWNFTRSELVTALGGSRVSVMNDFVAVAHGVAAMKDEAVHQIGGGRVQLDRPRVVLGAGTGLGVAALIPAGDGYVVVESEGGHADYAPIGDLQIEVKRKLRSQFNRVCVERVVSGPGLVNIASALCALKHRAPRFSTPAEIVAAALEDQDEVALETLDFFCEVAGAVAGNLALTFGAKGGVYIAGGVIPRFTSILLKSGFRSAFEDKGRFRDYLSEIPCFLVTQPDLGLFGAAQFLNLEHTNHA
ncbi:glucokinase [Pseudomonadales bacterium]|jgi:glucokinase|nr:glucokinase [Pseudomonadales bacterium]MDB2707171.1 glucokinase [Pseudomonadales bacterium]MDC1328012.1 glucokinase [Pseudomonadales bacterium]